MPNHEDAHNPLSDADTLWRSADPLRGAGRGAEYKHVVLCLLFLKYTSDSFESRGEQLKVELAKYGPAVRAGYAAFKADRDAKQLAAVAGKHGLPPESLQLFTDTILTRMIFDGQQLTDLLEPLNLGWRARTEKELALMADLVPLLKGRVGGREISGLNAYEG